MRARPSGAVLAGEFVPHVRLCTMCLAVLPSGARECPRCSFDEASVATGLDAETPTPAGLNAEKPTPAGNRRRS